MAQNSRLADVASRHLLGAGGKRVRPLLTLLAAAVGGKINDEVLDAAVVVELTHLATLYHDDVMDDATKRRGVDTAQHIWGNSVAILTGDLILARASGIVADLGPRAMSLQATTFERLVLGQLFETTGPEHNEDILTHYIKVIEGKTGSLIAAAGLYGSILSGASESVVQMLGRYGELIGVAFQLADDVIDVTGEGKVSGKTSGTDLREGIPTLPTILLHQEVEQNDAEALRVEALIKGDLSLAREEAHEAEKRERAEAEALAKEEEAAEAENQDQVASEKLAEEVPQDLPPEEVENVEEVEGVTTTDRVYPNAEQPYDQDPREDVEPGRVTTSGLSEDELLGEEEPETTPAEEVSAQEERHEQAEEMAHEDVEEELDSERRRPSAFRVAGSAPDLEAEREETQKASEKKNEKEKKGFFSRFFGL